VFSLSFLSSSESEIVPKRRRGATRRRNQVLGLESLEIRLTPTTDVWTGAAGVLWSNAANWSNGVPMTGQVLDFPATNVTNFTSVNDLTGGMSFDSIKIDGAGYDLIGNQVVLTGIAGIAATFTSGSSTDNINAVLDARNITVASGGTLRIMGALSGSAGLNLTVGSSATLELGGGVATTGGLTLSGGGTLEFTGASGNTYSGPTTINSGIAELNVSGGTAIPGDLVIGDGGNDAASVIDEASGQIGTNSNVTLEGSTASFNLSTFNEAINSLTLAGGSLITVSPLTLGAGGLAVGSGSPFVTLSANLDLPGAATPIDVPASVYLTLSGNISGAGGILKTGTGTLNPTGANTFIGATTLSDGSLSLTNSSGLANTSAVMIDVGGELELVTVHRGICASSARTAAVTNDDRLVLYGPVPQLYPRRAA
jgi:fibronectin-binding autotransporter adhesin